MTIDGNGPPPPPKKKKATDLSKTYYIVIQET